MIIALGAYKFIKKEDISRILRLESCEWCCGQIFTNLRK